jgi:ABC-type phosphate transport system substrate-binding protein
MSLLAKSKLKSLTGCLSLVALTVGFNQALIQPSLAVPTPINGSGSSFAQGLYQGTSPTGLFSTGGSWFSTYAGLPSPTYPDVIFNYAAVGSGTGVTSFRLFQECVVECSCRYILPQFQKWIFT